MAKCLSTSGASEAKRAEVAAGGEDLLVRGGEHDAADGVVVARGGERGEQVVEQLVRERVARLGPVHRDRGDAVGGDVVADGLEGHLHLHPNRSA